MKSHVIPTIFAETKEDFFKKLNKLKHFAKNIQIDIMDGSFVKKRSIDVEDIPDLKNLKIDFEAHLMVYQPEKYICQLKEKGIKKIIFHYESEEDIERISKLIKYEKMDAFIAINPDTKAEAIIYYINKFDGILIMGVHPGKEGQEFIQKVYDKIKKIREFNKKIKIEIDGGVNEKNAGKLASLGVDYINSGSYVSESENPKDAFKRLSLIFEKGKT